MPLLLFILAERHGLPVHAIHGIKNERAHSFRVGLHPQQVSLDIGMADNGCLFGASRAESRSLLSFFGKVEGMKISRAGLRHALHAHENPLLIHHMKHDLDAFSLRSQQFGNAMAVVAKVQHRRGGTFHAHLVFDSRTVDIIGFARGTVRGYSDLGQNKTGEAFRSSRITLDPGEKNVNDVFGQVLLSAGDEDFRSRNRIGSIRIPDSPGSDCADI